MADEFIYETYYRGLAAGEPLFWHICLGRWVVDSDGERSIKTRTLNMQQAVDEGWPVEKATSGINADAFAEIEKLQATIAARDSEIDAMKKARAESEAAMREQIAQLQAQHMAALEAHTVAIIRMQTRVAKAEAERDKALDAMWPWQRRKAVPAA